MTITQCYAAITQNCVIVTQSYAVLRSVTHVYTKLRRRQLADVGGRADSPPPTEITKESWRQAIGLQSPSSGTEVIYGSPEEEWEEEGEEEQEWYEESPEPEPLSPSTQKRIDDEFKRDVDECTTGTGSDWESGPEGKTLSEIDEKIAKWDRQMKESRMQAMQCRRVEGNSVQHVLATCIY